MSNQSNRFRLETYAERISREFREEVEQRRAEEAWGWCCFKALVKGVFWFCVFFGLALISALFKVEHLTNETRIAAIVVMVFDTMVLIVCERIRTYYNF
jgi:hypothetical protein